LNKRFWVLSLFAILAAVSFGLTDDSLNLSEFELTTFKSFQRSYEIATTPGDHVADVTPEALAVVVEFTGQARLMRSTRKEFIALLAKVGKDSNMGKLPKIYHTEIQVSEQNHTYWLPIQDLVFEAFSKEVAPHQEFTAYVRCFGSLGGEGCFYLLMDYRPDVRERVPHSAALLNVLGGVKLGTSMAQAIKTLSARLGPSFQKGEQEKAHYEAYALDPDHGTSLVITDAGGLYHDKVFSIQVSGPPNPAVDLYKSLHLGDSLSVVEKVLGRSAGSHDAGDGYTHFSYENPRYSVELKNGVLASFLISADPNYFPE
jgi:hypothetical protein